MFEAAHSRKQHRRHFAVVVRGAVLWLVTSVVVAVQVTGGAFAQQFFDTPRDFVIDKACDAHRSFKRQTDPVPVAPGETYVARGENRLGDPTHVFIRMGADNRWVALSCGHYAEGAGQGATTSPGRPAAGGAAPAPAECLPFFDTQDNPVKVGFGGTVDMTPPPPTLDAFDEAINAACGEPGKSVSEAELKALLLSHAGVLERIRNFTHGRVFPDRPPASDQSGYVDQLAEAWLAVKAFDHIMCGEPGTGRNTIGGLHFAGRYLQLQQSGLACRMPNFRQNEAVPGVLYTFGVTMRTASGGTARHARKGYGLTLSGEDLIKLVTRAFSENATTNADSTGCLLPVRDDGKDFTAVFVRRRAGIRTFYPDGTPSTKDPACAHTIDLQEETRVDDHSAR